MTAGIMFSEEGGGDENTAFGRLYVKNGRGCRVKNNSVSVPPGVGGGGDFRSDTDGTDTSRARILAIKSVANG